MLCTYCGAQIPDSSKHCPVCGAAQNAAPAWNEVAQDANQTVQADPAQYGYCADPQPDPYATKPKKEKKPLSKKAKTIIGISIAALVLIAIGLFLWLEIFTVRVFVPTKAIMQDADGEETMRITITYDNRGNPKKVITYKDGEEADTAEFKYNSKGHKKAAISYDADGEETGRTEFECDSKGNVTEESNYDEEGYITSRTEYAYNSKGYCIESTYFSYDDHGEESEGTTTEYEYDSKGNQTLALRYDAEGKLLWKEEYEYDKNSNCTLSVFYSYYNDEDGKETSRYERTYNKKNKITKEFYYENGSDDWNRLSEYEYDKKGHLKQINRYDKDNNLTSYTKVKCDDNGNPTRETSFYVDQDGEETEGSTTILKYKEFRMTKQQAKKLQEEMNGAVLIDEGWFPN